MTSLQWSDEMTLAAQDHCRDIGSQRLVSHIGTDKSQFWERVGRYGFFGGGAENIAVGAATGMDFMLQFYIDEGLASKGHRKNIINPNYKYTGIASCKSATYGKMLIVVYAS
jgi:uncharacterized protein YkwD